MRDKRIQVLLILGLVLLARIPDLPYHYMDWDEAAMMSQAWALTQGQLLYRDVWQIHPVLNFAVFYPFFARLDPDAAPHAIKLLNLFLVAFGALLVRRICSSWMADETCSLMAALIFVFYFAFRWAQSSYGEFYALFPILLSVYLLFLSPGPALRNCILVGFLWAAAILFKQVALFDALGLFLGYLCFHRDRMKRKLAASLELIAGAACMVVPISVHLWSKGVLKESLQSMLFRPLTGYTQLAPTPDLSFGAIVLQRLMLLSDEVIHIAVPFGAPIILAAFGVFYALRIRGDPTARFRSPRPDPDTDQRKAAFFCVLVVWLASGLLGIASIGRLFPHYQVQLIPIMALLCAYGPSFLPRRGRMALLLGVIVASFAICGYVCVERLQKTRGSPHRVLRSTRIAAFIRSNTAVDDRIFLYRVDNLDIFYLAGRVSNNGIYMFIDMFEEHSRDAKAARERREEFLRSLPKALLVDPQGPLLGCESAVGFFRDVMNEHYELRAVIEGVEIYFLRSVSPPLPGG